MDFLERGVYWEPMLSERTVATVRLWFWLGNAYSRLRCNEAAPQFGLSFSAMLSHLSNRVQQAGLESFMTRMKGSIRLNMSCGCILQCRHNGWQMLRRACW